LQLCSYSSSFPLSRVTFEEPLLSFKEERILLQVNYFQYHKVFQKYILHLSDDLFLDGGDFVNVPLKMT
jgi:hypothetical protein